MAYISEYTTDVVHTPGTSNVVTDLLSCPPPLPLKTPPISSGGIQGQGEHAAASTQAAATEMLSSRFFAGKHRHSLYEGCCSGNATSDFSQDSTASAATPAATLPVNHQEMALR